MDARLIKCKFQGNILVTSFSHRIPLSPMVLKVSSTSPLLFSLVSFFGDGGKSASFLPFFFPGDFDRFPADGLLPDFFPLSSFLPASAAFAALNISQTNDQ